MNTTIKQIAEKANVSRGTVDRVIHGRYGVDPDIRTRVLAIMKELNYHPNAMARALKGVQNPVKLGAIVPNRANPFYLDIHAGIDQAAKTVAAYGIEVIKLEMEKMTPENQIAYIDQLEQMQVRGIMLVAIDHDSVRARINALPDSIPVVTFNSDIPGTKRLCFVGNDHITAGRVAGRMMSIVLQKPGKVALMISQSDLLAHVERTRGFRQVFEEIRPDVEFIGPLMTYESETLAYQVAAQLLKQEPELAGIYVAGGGQQAAARALAQSGRAGQVKMVCHDMLPETVKYVKSGVVDFTIGQEAFVQGYMPVEILYEYHMFGRRPRLDTLFTRIDIRMQDNVSIKGYEVFTGL
ncbi:MAG: substrate-binding domain-containing protein, partial [Clostridia bacterium]